MHYPAERKVVSFAHSGGSGGGLRADSRRPTASFLRAHDQIRSQLRQRPQCVVHPRHTWWASRWDALVVSGLLYTAIVSPIDVCIVQERHVWLFILNITTDLIFVVDLILNFFIAYRSNEDEDGGRWITDRRAIACHYLKTWFAVDFLSVLPFEILNFLEMLEGASLIRAVRTLRLLRLIKLLRILRASRIARRWRDFFDLSHSSTSILLFALVTAFLVHLMACVWAACGLYWYPTEGLTLGSDADTTTQARRLATRS